MTPRQVYDKTKTITRRNGWSEHMGDVDWVTRIEFRYPSDFEVPEDDLIQTYNYLKWHPEGQV